MKKIQTIGLVGLGLIGGSIARAIRFYYPNITIIATSGHENTLNQALEEQVIHKGFSHIDSAFSVCDYIFLCAPVTFNGENLEKLKPIISKDCIITDVGSTKSDIHRKVHALGLDRQFIGGHPMAGSEKTGLSNSKKYLIENAYYVITPCKEVPQDKVSDFVKFIASLKALPIVMDYKEHDYVVAAISHVPHLIAASLVKLVKTNDSPKQYMKTVAAGGFKDITRVASSSPVMWEQICVTNHKNISLLLADYISSLQDIKEAVDRQDKDYIHQLFLNSRTYRDSISDRLSGSIPKVFGLYVELMDKAGGIATISTILAKHQISIKNIGIVHNREFEEAVLQIEFYEAQVSHRAADLLKEHDYIVYER